MLSKVCEVPIFQFFPFVPLRSFAKFLFLAKIRIFPDKLPVAQVERALRQEELLQRMRNSVEKALAVAVKGSEDVRKTAEKVKIKWFKRLTMVFHDKHRIYDDV